MKRCPKCNTDYFDNLLEFCLEDGARLVLLSETAREFKTVTNDISGNPATAKTEAFAFAPIAPETRADPLAEKTQSNPSAVKKIETRVKNTGLETLSIAPIILSLAHNWTQWIYLDRGNYGSVSAFLVSPDFLIWMFLLLTGAIVGLLALKYCEKKGFAYAGLIILAINLLLFLIPKR